MNWRQVVAVIGLALTSGSARADEGAISRFFGEWHGTAVSITGPDHGLNLAPKDLDVGIQDDGNGFLLNWTALRRADQTGGEFVREAVDAKFVPTERPGVFAFEPGGSSLLSRLFADPATGNPLKGETLLWARLDGPTLTVYSLAINSHGGFDLDRYARTLSEGGMHVHYTHRMENDQVLTVEGQLKPAGG
jgi:hypothetical protein